MCLMNLTLFFVQKIEIENSDIKQYSEKKNQHVWTPSKEHVTRIGMKQCLGFRVTGAREQ